MTFGNKGIYAVIFLSVFFMILIIGVTSEVSLSASFNRAFLAAAGFTLLSWGLGRLMTTFVFQEPVMEEADTFLVERLGANLDLTVNDPEPSEQEEQFQPEQNLFKTTPAKVFSPLTAKQIDPQVNKIINSDPKKVAEIVRKMGFEEE